MLEAVRIPDSNRDLADSNRRRIAQADPRKGTAADANHGEVGRGIVSDHVGVGLAAIWQTNANGQSPVHDVAVRDDQTVRREEESRPGTARLFRRPVAVMDLDANDGGTNDVHGPDDRTRVGVEELVIPGTGRTVSNGAERSHVPILGTPLHSTPHPFGR